jgi:signal transduction histidine kinase
MTHHLQDKIAAATRELALSNSDLARQQAELEESNRKLTELDRAKTEFVSIVSHELQTPLTNIIGFAQTIQKLHLPKEKIERYLKIIEFEGRRLAALIEDYLDVSKIEMGSFELRRTEFDMRDLIKETVPVIDVPPDITIPTALPAQPCPLVADKDRLKQVIVNVLSNAIRYTGPGGAIAIRCEDFSDRVLVHIQDQGPGIPADDQKRVFEKFFRRADDISKKSRGSGLGLYIVKNIIELHHGSVWIDSAPGEGSTFSFSLPKEGAQP